MNQSSERIAVFVTPAQKRALATKAQSLGISISELVRRAVLAFDETADDVRAARIVDSWRTPAAPDSLNETLRRIADAALARAPHSRAEAALGEAPPETPVVSAGPAGDGERDEAMTAPPSPVPVASAVAQALACEPVDAPGAADDEPRFALDLDTVTRLTSRWSETSADDTREDARSAAKRFRLRPA
jgi:hypothetical protein